MSKKAIIQITAEYASSKMFEDVLKRNGISKYMKGYIDGVSVFHAEDVEWDNGAKLVSDVGKLIKSLMSDEYDDKQDYAFRMFVGTECGIEEYCNERGYRSLDVGFSDKYGVHNPYLVGSNWDGDDNTPIPGTIVIPNKCVTKTDENAVTFREYLTFYKINDGITEIGEKTFEDCELQHGIDFSDSVAKIGEGAFIFCRSLKKVELPNGVTEIGNNAFETCLNLISVVIPNSVTKVGECAFGDCQSLESIELPNSITEIGKSVFSSCAELTSVKIPNSVTKICDEAFSGCQSLASIELPNGITEIGDEAFACCYNLKDIRYNGTRQQWDNVRKGKYWFRYIGTRFIHCADGDVELPCEVIDGTVYKECLIPLDKDYTIPDGVTEIAANAFRHCGFLTSVTIPNGVTKIGKSAFCFCTSLESVTLPNGLTDIDDTAFSRCPRLKL